LAVPGGVLVDQVEQLVSLFELFTEYKREGSTYHAHPNYNSFGEWYDWTQLTMIKKMILPKNNMDLCQQLVSCKSNMFHKIT